MLVLIGEPMTSVLESELMCPTQGTGKTLVAKAVANESACNFVSLSIPTIIHGEVCWIYEPVVMRS